MAPLRDEDLPRRVNEKENALQKQQLRQAEADAVTDGSKSAIQRAIEIQANAESQELGVAAL
jgi:F0F1-type ATP synthase assembly protein I